MMEGKQYPVKLRDVFAKENEKAAKDIIRGGSFKTFLHDIQSQTQNTTYVDVLLWDEDF